MSFRSDIRKILFVAFWACIGGGMLTLLLAAIHKQNRSDCKGYTIEIRGAKNIQFISKADAEVQLLEQLNGSPEGKPLSSVHLDALQHLWEKNTWVRRAELYFDSKDILHIILSEKEPVARIFTTAGNSFYIDSAENRLPLSDKFSARLPVFTDFPDKKTYTAKDSALLEEVKTIACFISAHAFWNAQAAQFDVTPQRTFIMVPLIGNHIVRLGHADDLENKFNRLMAFYQQVLGKTGFNKYRIIDVQYAGQVVASRFIDNPVIDSLQLKNNIDKLLQESKLIQTDMPVNKGNAVLPIQKNSFRENDTVSEEKINETRTDPRDNTGPAETKPVVKKTESNTKKMIPAKKNRKIPKAVMPPQKKEDANGGYN